MRKLIEVTDIEVYIATFIFVRHTPDGFMLIYFKDTPNLNEIVEELQNI